MRVLCSGLDGSDVEGEVIGGKFNNPDTGRCDLEETSTVRCDNGEVFQVHGWDGGCDDHGRDAPVGNVGWPSGCKAQCIVHCGREKILANGPVCELLQPEAAGCRVFGSLREDSVRARRLPLPRL